MLFLLALLHNVRFKVGRLVARKATLTREEERGEEEKQEILAHVRDLVYTEGRRGSADDLEMGALRSTGREAS